MEVLCKDLAPGCANVRKEKVFISVSLDGRGEDLAKGPWGRRVEQLIHILGPNNVYLNVYETGGGEPRTAKLEYLGWRVECGHSIVSDGRISLSILPNVTLPDGSQLVKRAAYVAEIRNRALRRLDLLKDGDDALVKFDKVLFLDDIAFRPLDAAQLLFSTNMKHDGRADYLAACGLDYHSAFRFHDVHALRDMDGYANTQAVFPIFGDLGGGLSRADMLAGKDAVRVKSCWSGITAVQAKYVQNLNQSLPDPGFRDVGRHVVDPAHPTNATTPVRFRHEPEVFFDASESCLFMADLAQAAGGADANEAGIYVNPYVRVSHSERTLRWVRIMRYWERLFVFAHDLRALFSRPGDGNPYRDVVEGQKFAEEVWDHVEHEWKVVERVGRAGLFCGMREARLGRPGERAGETNRANMRIPPVQTPGPAA